MKTLRLARRLGVVATATALVLLSTTPGHAAPAAGAPEATAPTAPALPGKVRLGTKSSDVRILQSRLNQLGLHDDYITATFDEDTRHAVAVFQKRNKLKGASGVAGKTVWKKLYAVTRAPSKAELRNDYTVGKVLLKKGSKNTRVRTLEARLKQQKVFSGKVNATYDAKTVKAVKKFQAKVKIPVSGKVDARTLAKLEARTRTPNRTELFNLTVHGSALDARCKTGRVLCIDKSTNSMRWVVDGVVTSFKAGGATKTSIDVRFGNVTKTPTREGEFTVFRKSRDHVSSLYGSPMPFAMFFSGGQAVHFSSDFAARGYNGASHGCVNVRDRAAIVKLFDDIVRLGDKVVVYRS
ncbi:L,D-transpeptidase family protein [Nocardioides yefusunii]|uniref:Peptidoglycan-binding protein n=1 Tax=Nocardioides yefusunii TaxID=2500546 RepID=A0ABW1QXG4_9ACTN|nr:peptidoglycan-binding protein [Nocardioides yefusunii]